MFRFIFYRELSSKARKRNIQKYVYILNLTNTPQFTTTLSIMYARLLNKQKKYKQIITTH